MVALLVSSLFAFGPAPGPIDPSPARTHKPWRIFLATSSYRSVNTFDLPQGILVENGDLALLDPQTGKLRWRVPPPVALQVRSVSGENGIILMDAEGRMVRLDPATGRTLNAPRRFPLRPAYPNPYEIPVSDAFWWHGGWVLRYGQGSVDVEGEEGPVGLAFVHEAKVDDWHGSYLHDVIRGPMGTAIGDLDGHGDDGPERRIYSRVVCADEEGVWALRRGFGQAGDLVHISPLGYENAGPPVDVTEGLPAWTRNGIVFARAGALYRFDGRASRRTLIFSPAKTDRCGPWTARLTRWGVIRIGSFGGEKKAWSVVRLYPFPE